VTGSSDSDLGGTLTVRELSVDPSDELNLGASSSDGVTVTGENGATGTIAGTVDGSGTFTVNSSNSSGVEDVTGNGFDPGALDVETGTLNLDGTSASAGSVDLTGGTTTFGGSGDTLAVTGEFQMPQTGTDAALQGPGTMTVGGAFDLQSGDINEMTITQNGTGTFAIDGTSGVSSQPALNDSAITTNSSGSVTFANQDFNSQAPSPSSITSTAEPIAIAAGNYNAEFDNASGYTLSAPGFDLTSGSANLVQAQLVVTGSGDSDLTSTLTAESLSIDPGDELSLGSAGSAGITVTDAGKTGTIAGTLDGSGTFTDDGGTTTVSSTATFEPNILDVVDGTLTFDAASSSAGSVDLTGGTTTFGGSGDTLAVTGEFQMPQTGTDAALQGPGTMTVGGAFDLQSGDINEMTITQNGTGTFAIDGTSGVSSQPALNDSAITTNSSGSVTLDNSDFNSQAPSPSSITSTAEPFTIAPGSYTAAFDNNSGYTLSAPGFNLSGNTDLASGTLTLTGGTTTIPPSDTLTAVNVNVAGGTLDGTGTIAAPVSNTSGTIAPGDAPGTLTIDGNYTQGPAGVLQIADDGPGTAGTSFSQLDVVGSASLGGTLAMVPSSGYASSAAPGDSVEVLAATSTPSGTFGSVTSNPTLQDGESYSAVYSNPDQVDALVGTAQPPSNTAPPQVTGTAQQGDQLSSTTGTWTNSPSSYGYQWSDCTSSAATSCTAITGATASTYTLTATDVGQYVIVVVTAHNESASTASATGTPVKGPVLALAPTDTTAPTITGTPDVGDTVSCNPGTWTGSPTFSYTWELDGTVTPGVTTSTYTIPTTAAGGTLICAVKATNTGGSATAPSAPVSVPSVGAAAPTSAPTPALTSAPTPAPVPLLLSCSGKDIELVSVSVKGHFVLLAGIALKQFAGQRVTITLSDVSHKVAKGKGGATTVAADGTFQVKLPVPKGPTVGLTRYTATVAGHASLGLKLARALLITAEHNAPGGLQVSFKGTGVLAKGSHTIEIVQQVSCTKSIVFERKKLGPSATLTVTLPAPSEAGAVAYYRAQTPTSAGLTYSLPIAVEQGA
jgi:fibronectin-binding autotransporter adhesin